VRSAESWESRVGREGGLSASCVVFNGPCVCDEDLVKGDLLDVVVVVDRVLRSVNCFVCGVIKAVVVAIGNRSSRYVVILREIVILGLFFCRNKFSSQWA